MCIYIMCVPGTCKEDIGSPGTRVQNGYEISCGNWTQDLLFRYQVFLTAEPSLQTHKLVFLKYSYWVKGLAIPDLFMGNSEQVFGDYIQKSGQQTVTLLWIKICKIKTWSETKSSKELKGQREMYNIGNDNLEKGPALAIKLLNDFPECDQNF